MYKRQRYASTRDLARDLASIRDRLADVPARHSEPRPNNLPVQRTAFIGREPEAATLGELLRRADVRLVTITAVSYTHLDVYKRQEGRTGPIESAPRFAESARSMA